jgi:hypothetical protein
VSRRPSDDQGLPFENAQMLLKPVAASSAEPR